MGFSQERGDSLNVVNSAFARAAKAAMAGAELPFWRDREQHRARQDDRAVPAARLLALFAWLAVLRPLLRKHLGRRLPASRRGARHWPPRSRMRVTRKTKRASNRPNARAARRHSARRPTCTYAHETADKDPQAGGHADQALDEQQ
jgi:flagellar M-ring protein FliF